MSPTEAEREIAKELEADERLMWSGAPREGVVLRRGDIILIPFSVLWGGFAIFWEATVLRSGAPLFFALWGIPFVLVGLYLIFGRFFVDAKSRARTAYGVTDRRIVVVAGLRSRSVRSLPLSAVPDRARRDGGWQRHDHVRAESSDDALGGRGGLARCAPLGRDQLRHDSAGPGGVRPNPRCAGRRGGPRDVTRLR